MPNPIQPRGVHRAVGAFVLVGVVGLIAVTLLAVRAHDWFRPMHELALTLPPDGSFGLREGADVELLGTRVGSVADIHVDEESGRMEATLSIRSDFARYIGTDSAATIRKRFAVGGDSFIELSRSTSADAEPIPPEGATLVATADRGPTDMLEQVIERVREEAVPAIQEMRATVAAFRTVAEGMADKDGPTQQLLTNLNELADRLRDPDAPLQSLLARLNDITTSIVEGKGAIGRLVADEKWANELDASLQRLTGTLTQAEKTLATADDSVREVGKLATSLQESSAELPDTLRKSAALLEETRGAVADLRGASSQLPELVTALTDGAKTLPGLVLQTESTIRDAQTLLRGMQQHWLLRDYVSADRAPARIGEAP